MKVDITIQLILFVINIGLASSALIYYRKATRLKGQAEEMTSRMEAQNNSLYTLRGRIERIRTLILKKIIPVPECIKFDSIERARFIDANLNDMACKLALNMRADGLIKIESISEEKDFTGKFVLALEISALVLPPANNSRLPL